MEFKTLEELFADESRWTKKFFAVDSEGKNCSPRNPNAVSYSLMGGLIKLYSQKPNYHYLRDRLMKVILSLGMELDKSNIILDFETKCTYQQLKLAVYRAML